MIVWQDEIYSFCNNRRTNLKCYTNAILECHNTSNKKLQGDIMTLIELFTDYVRNQKSLKEYVEKRKSIDSRGEFNNQTLIQAQEDLERLKKENPKIYDLMYETLDKYYEEDKGYTVEYPIDFIREILKIYQHNMPAQEVYEGYVEGLNHPCRDA